MEYRKAKMGMEKEINQVIQQTIMKTYPHYYPEEVVEFFSQLHNLEHTREGILSGNMRILEEDHQIVGVGCYDKNHITGVYILPEFQNKGYGRKLMKELEKEITKDNNTVLLESSLPGVFLYEHLGYKTIGHEMIELINNIKLVYEVMQKEFCKSD